MAPLNEENDDEDDSTLFDIKYRFEFSKWHQNSSSCGTKQIIFLLLSCSNMTILFHRPLWGCFSLCSVVGSPFSHFHCRLTHNYLLKGRRCPVYLHSNMFLVPVFTVSSAQISLSFCRWTQHVQLQFFPEDNSSVATDAACAWLLSV